jgi:hypothetical protein
LLGNEKDKPAGRGDRVWPGAEAVAFVVSGGVGLETNSAADYIALYNRDKKTLADSFSVIQATSSRILDDLLPERQTTFEKPQPAPSAPEIHQPAEAGQNAQRSQPPIAESPVPHSQEYGGLER